MCYDKGSNKSLRLTALDAETEKINIFLVTVSFTSHKTLFLDDWGSVRSAEFHVAGISRNYFCRCQEGIEYRRMEQYERIWM